MRTVESDLQSRPRWLQRDKPCFPQRPPSSLALIIPAFLIPGLILYHQCSNFILSQHNSFATLEPMTHKNIDTAIIFSLPVFKSSSTGGCHHDNSLAYFRTHFLAKPQFFFPLCVSTVFQTATSYQALNLCTLSHTQLAIITSRFFSKTKTKQKTLTTQKKIYKLFPKQPSSRLNCQQLPW